MNIWTFTGHLGKNAEIRALPNGTAVCGFSVAVTSGYGDKQKTTWVQCSIFGKRAEGNLPQCLTTGQKVAISGEAYLDQWEKDGQKNAIMKVNVNTVDLIGAKLEERVPRTSLSATANHQQEPPAGGFDNFDDDIPF